MIPLVPQCPHAVPSFSSSSKASATELRFTLNQDSIGRLARARDSFLKRWREFDKSNFPRETQDLLGGRARNAIKDHLTPDDLSAYIKEKKGLQILDRNGIPYDHIDEVESATEGVVRQIGAIKGRLAALQRTGTTVEGETAALQRMLSDLSSLLDAADLP
jgi:hypothetical protein